MISTLDSSKACLVCDMSIIASINLMFAALEENFDLTIKIINHSDFSSIKPQVSLQDHGELQLNLLHLVLVLQEIKVSIECKDESH